MAGQSEDFGIEAKDIVDIRAVGRGAVSGSLVRYSRESGLTIGFHLAARIQGRH